MLMPKDFIQVNIKAQNGEVITFYLTSKICIVPGVNIHYIPEKHFKVMKDIFPENTKDIVYEDSMDNAIANAAAGFYNLLEMTVATTGVNTKAIAVGNDDVNLLH